MTNLLYIILGKILTVADLIRKVQLTETMRLYKFLFLLFTFVPAYQAASSRDLREAVRGLREAAREVAREARREAVRGLREAAREVAREARREALREVARGLKEAKIGLREGHNGGVTYHGDITDYTHVRYNYNIGDAKKEVRKEFQKDTNWN